MQKRFIGIIFIFIICCITASTIAAPTTANQVNTITAEEISASYSSVQLPKLSDMTDIECLEFIKSKGVQIPDDYNDETLWAPFVKKTIEQVEADPDCFFVYNYTVTGDFAQAIQAVVNEYYGIPNSTIFYNEHVTPTSYSVYSLQDSSTYVSWSAAFKAYNCYAFAIGRTDKFYRPGELSGKSYDLSLGLDTLVQYIEFDLKAINNPCVDISTARPVIGSLNDNQTAICFRIGSEDFHFMRMESDGWYHKPGNTTPLKYNSLPMSSTIWTNECVYYGRVYKPTTEYDSVIYFITYAPSHNLRYSYSSSAYHTISCTECDYITAGSCTYTYTGNDDQTHTATCTVCGHKATSNCSWEYRNLGNGTHSATCTICSNEITSACDLQYTNLSNSHHKVECSQCSYEVTRELCTLTYTPNSDRTHTVKCTLCTNSYENGCGFTSEYVDPDQHRLNCSRCGKTVLDDCTPENTYCGDETNGDIHAKICPICDHVTEGTSETCTFAYKSNGENTHVYACTQCRYVKSGPVACMFKSDNKCRFCGALKNSAILNAQEEAFSEN